MSPRAMLNLLISQLEEMDASVHLEPGNGPVSTTEQVMGPYDRGQIPNSPVTDRQGLFLNKEGVNVPSTSRTKNSGAILKI